MLQGTMEQQRKVPLMMEAKYAAEYVGLKYRWLRNMIAQGSVTYIRCGQKYIVNVDKLIETLQTGDPGKLEVTEDD